MAPDDWKEEQTPSAKTSSSSRTDYQKGLEVCYCLWGVPSRPSLGSYPGPVQVPSRVRGGPVQIRHVLCFTVFRTHPGPEVAAIPARPGPILLASVPSRIGPGRAETDFLATSDTNCHMTSLLRDSAISSCTPKQQPEGPLTEDLSTKESHCEIGRAFFFTTLGVVLPHLPGEIVRAIFREWPRYCRKVYRTKMVQNGPEVS